MGHILIPILLGPFPTQSWTDYVRVKDANMSCLLGCNKQPLWPVKSGKQGDDADQAEIHNHWSNLEPNKAYQADLRLSDQRKVTKWRWPDQKKMTGLMEDNLENWKKPKI